MPNTQTITEKEAAVIQGMARCSMDFNGVPGGDIWTCEVASYSDMTPASLGGVFASLIEKGLIWSSGEHGRGSVDERTCGLTDDGVAALG